MNLAIVVKKMKNKMTDFLLNRNFEKLNEYHFNILQDNFYDDKNENVCLYFS